MKVLVTGGCGFIGSHVCEFYRARGDEVIAYDNMTKFELERTGYCVEKARDYNWHFLRDLGVDTVRGDIRNYEQLLETAKGCDFIVHTAAQPAMTIAVESPDLDFATNVMGTINVLKTAREFNIPVVSCATIHVYGNKINESLRETETRLVRSPAEIDETLRDMEGTLTPLHASKRSAEMYLQVFVDTYKVRAASYRLTGLYGPRQLGGEDHGWVANFSIRALFGWPIHIYGNGKQVRDILFATDVVTAFHAFYENQVPGIYNIGGGSQNAISLLESIDIIAEINGKRPTVIMKEGRLGDLHYFICDSSKARQNLKWSATVRPKEGIQRLMEWLCVNRDLFKQQI